jgi:predicted ATPase
MPTFPEEVAPEVATHRKPPFLRRVRIRNFKSIKFCDVTLEPLTVLVGRNGSGKSNFVEALAFLRDVVTWGVEKAVTLHGGPSVKFRTDHEPVEFEVEYDSQRPVESDRTEPARFQYRLRLTGISDRPRIALESLVDITGNDERSEFYGSDNGRIQPVQFSRLGSREAESRPLKSILDYEFDPQEMRRPQPSDALPTLAKSGVNLASVLYKTQHLTQDRGWSIGRIQRYLSQVVNEVLAIAPAYVGGHGVISFTVKGKPDPLHLGAAAMSDGTLRVLATLVAVYQRDYSGPPSLVAIEEPETSLHPAAMHALVDALDEATGRTQILLTTHSTELLDNPTIRPENVRVVEMVNGETVITSVDDASVEIVKRQLDTLGGLERQNQLTLNDDDRERQAKLAAGADAK